MLGDWRLQHFDILRNTAGITRLVKIFGFVLYSSRLIISIMQIWQWYKIKFIPPEYVMCYPSVLENLHYQFIWIYNWKIKEAFQYKIGYDMTHYLVKSFYSGRSLYSWVYKMYISIHPFLDIRSVNKAILY